MDGSDILLEPEQHELLLAIAAAYGTLDRRDRRDFRYTPALTRRGASPRAEIERVLDQGSSTSILGRLVTRKEEIPWGYDRDVIEHPGLEGGHMETLQSDVDALSLQNLIRFRDSEHFFLTPKGLRHSSPAPALANQPVPQDRTDALDEAAPTAFVSYAWEDEEHRRWVHDLAARLRGDGVDVTLDQWSVAPGDQLPAFMERAVRENDHVLIVCTPRYRQRSDARSGGVGYEGDVMTAEALTGADQRKFIPLLRRGEWAGAAPSWLMGKYYVDLRAAPHFEERYQDLLLTLHGQRPGAPPLGPSPFRKVTQAGEGAVSLSRERAAAMAPEDAPEPIRITGIIVDEVSVPKNDGSRGSALYTVPFQLSRRPSSEWARLFVECWDRPPQFTTMHRPGIARVIGDRAILDGTTVEEVERYHRMTLKLVVDQVNQVVAQREAERQRMAEAERQQMAEHAERVRDAAARISFD